jgi:hypothetical protein
VVWTGLIWISNSKPITSIITVLNYSGTHTLTTYLYQHKLGLISDQYLQYVRLNIFKVTELLTNAVNCIYNIISALLNYVKIPSRGNSYTNGSITSLNVDKYTTTGYLFQTKQFPFTAQTMLQVMYLHWGVIIAV